MGKFSALAGTGKPHRVFSRLGGEPLLDKDGNPAWIDVHSEDSAAGRAFEREWQNHILDLAKEGRELPSQRQKNAEKCAALTANWYLVNPDTLEPIHEPCTRENAKELYSLSDTIWLWADAFQAANNNENFIKRSARKSTSSQSTTSETAAS